MEQIITAIKISAAGISAFSRNCLLIYIFFEKYPTNEL